MIDEHEAQDVAQPNIDGAEASEMPAPDTTNIDDNSGTSAGNEGTSNTPASPIVKRFVSSLSVSNLRSRRIIHRASSGLKPKVESTVDSSKMHRRGKSHDHTHTNVIASREGGGEGEGDHNDGGVFNLHLRSRSNETSTHGSGPKNASFAAELDRCNLYQTSKNTFFTTLTKHDIREFKGKGKEEVDGDVDADAPEAASPMRQAKSSTSINSPGISFATFTRIYRDDAGVRHRSRSIDGAGSKLNVFSNAVSSVNEKEGFQTSVTISSSEIQPDTLIPYTVYMLVVEAPHTGHIVFRRYREFYLLREQVCKEFPEARSISFPPKKWHVGPLSAKTAARRRKGLEAFVQHVLAIENIGQCRALARFLNFPEEEEDGNGRAPVPVVPGIGQSDALTHVFRPVAVEEGSPYASPAIHALKLGEGGEGVDETGQSRIRLECKVEGGDGDGELKKGSEGESERQEEKEKEKEVNVKVNADTDAAEVESPKVKPKQKQKPAAKLRIADFPVLAVLGKGGYGTVFLVRKKDTGEILALKKLKKSSLKSKNQIALVKTERDILVLSTTSPWLVSLKYSFQDSQNLYLAMEFVAGGDFRSLFMNLGRLDEDSARFYAAEMVSAVATLHNLGYIHRDLKPENFMIDAVGHVKLTDFGLSKSSVAGKMVDAVRENAETTRWPQGIDRGRNRGVSSGDGGDGCDVMEREDAAKGVAGVAVGRYHRAQTIHALGHSSISGGAGSGSGSGNAQAMGKWKKVTRNDSIVGSPNYMAPEILARSKYGKEVDYWSLGCIIFEMLVGFPPFTGSTPEECIENVLDHERTLVKPTMVVDGQLVDAISQPAWSLISSLLQPVTTRLGEPDKIAAHPFFEGIDWAELRTTEPPFVPDLDSPIDISYFDPPEMGPDMLDEELGDMDMLRAKAKTFSSSHSHSHSGPLSPGGGGGIDEQGFFFYHTGDK